MATRTKKPKYEATFTPLYRVAADMGGQKVEFIVPLTDLPNVRNLFANMTNWCDQQIAALEPPEEESAVVQMMKDPGAE